MSQTYNNNEFIKRETEIFGLLVQGLSDREIARRLVISYNTSKNHVASILHKFGVKNRKELIAKFYEKKYRVSDEIL